MTTVTLPEPADVVTFSYSLTMIPNWYLALENARKLLAAGRMIAVVDFYVARKHPARRLPPPFRPDTLVLADLFQVR